MDIYISEIQFSTAVTIELSEGYVKSVHRFKYPFFPSQRIEKHLGFDLGFIANGFKIVLFQFKIPQVLTSSRASQWGFYNDEYFRIRLLRKKGRSDQHNSLVRAARSGGNRVGVYYCAPAFIDYIECNQYYELHQVFEHSCKVNCRTLPLINDSKQHYITYSSDPSEKVIMHSFPYEIDASEMDFDSQMDDDSDYFRSTGEFLDWAYDFTEGKFNGETLGEFADLMLKEIGTVMAVYPID